MGTPHSTKPRVNFWDVDLREAFALWASQVWTLILTALTFVGMAMPVLVAAVVLWYLAGFPRIKF